MKRFLTSAADLENTVLELGFLPFFRNAIPGFSVEEMTTPDMWFNDDKDGPWEWKGPVSRRLNVAYGKTMAGKAMFISKQWYADFALWRRAARPFESSVSAPFTPADVLKIINDEGPILSSDLKKMFDALPRRRRTATDLVDLTGLNDIEYRSNRNTLERYLTALQMSGRLLIEDFQYARSKDGRDYGWGLARYNTPENMFGIDFLAQARAKNPAEAMHLMFNHLAKILPSTPERKINSLLK